MEQSNADARDDGTARPHQPGDVLPSSTQSATSQRRSARKATLATTEHVCFECGLPFTSSNSLTVHLRLHSGDQPYQCTACGKRFLHKSQLMVHERSHSGETPFACPLCPKAFRHRESLVTHSSTHTGIKPYQCQCCEARFSCIGNLIKHRRCRPETCGLPQYSVENVKCAPRPSGRVRPPKRAQSSKRSVAYDDDFHDGVGDDTEVCNEEETANTDDAVVELPCEANAKEVMADRPAGQATDDGYECMDDADAESLHMTVEYLMDDEDWSAAVKGEPELVAEQPPLPDCVAESSAECTRLEIETCAQENNHDDDIGRNDNGDDDGDNGDGDDHVGSTTDTKLRLLALNTQPALQSARLGSAPRVYALQCNRCSRRFTKRALLRQHQKSECGRQPQYDCDQCGRRYQSAGSLRSHRSVHTGERPFRCEHCGEAFRTKHQVQVHTRRHTGERPYACDQCDKRFAHRESALTHRAVHDATAKRFWCVQCGARYSCIRNLQMHRAARPATCGRLPLVTRPLREVVVKAEAAEAVNGRD